MANTKSALKRIKTDERNRQRNIAVKSRLRTYVTRALKALEGEDADAAKQAVLAALSEIDKAASKGIIHRNAAGRKKAMLQRRAASLN